MRVIKTVDACSAPGIAPERPSSEPSGIGGHILALLGRAATVDAHPGDDAEQEQEQDERPRVTFFALRDPENDEAIEAGVQTIDIDDSAVDFDDSASDSESWEAPRGTTESSSDDASTASAARAFQERAIWLAVTLVLVMGTERFLAQLIPVLTGPAAEWRTSAVSLQWLTTGVALLVYLVLLAFAAAHGCCSKLSGVPYAEGGAADADASADADTDEEQEPYHPFPSDTDLEAYSEADDETYVAADDELYE